ncbi:Hypothetical predicted protein, partial [Pelobates cultripes]
MDLFTNRDNWQDKLANRFECERDNVNSNNDDLDYTCHKLQQLLVKETKIKWEIFTMTKYLENNITPRGLRFFKTPTFDRDDSEFIEIWDAALESFSVRMMKICIQQRKRNLLKLDTEINQIKEKLRPLTGCEEVEKSLETVKDFVEKVEQETVAIKKKKFLRDKNDYAFNR